MRTASPYNLLILLTTLLSIVFVRCPDFSLIRFCCISFNKFFSKAIQSTKYSKRFTTLLSLFSNARDFSISSLQKLNTFISLVHKWQSKLRRYLSISSVNSSIERICATSFAMLSIAKSTPSAMCTTYIQNFRFFGTVKLSPTG